MDRANSSSRAHEHPAVPAVSPHQWRPCHVRVSTAISRRDTEPIASASYLRSLAWCGRHCGGAILARFWRSCYERGSTHTAEVVEPCDGTDLCVENWVLNPDVQRR